MEERISEGETRRTASGLALQTFIEALQQKRAKLNKKPTDQQPESIDEPQEDTGDTESGESWKSNLFLAPKKLHERWEQYSPSFKDKFQKYSPNPIKKIKELFAQPEEKSSEEIETDKDDVTMEGEENGVEILQESEDKYKSIAAFYLDNDDDNLNNKSSQKNEVPSNEKYQLLKNNNSGTGNKKKSLDKPPFIVLQEPDSTTNELNVIGIESDVVLRRKSPLTVQEWVDHLPSKPKLLEKDCEDSSGSKDSDNLGLSDVPTYEDKRSLIAAKLSREASVQSSSSLDSLLDARRPDPVEVLLNLGFGAVPGVDMEHCRIPKRFLVPSKCKGGDWNEFLRRELLQAQNFECASLGFRGLSGPSHQRPSAIVANIMEKLRERTAPRPPTKPKFSTVAKRVLNEKSVLNKLAHPEPSQSVLSPDNRKFLDSQGKISPEVPRRRIIFGQKSFAFANDGELIEVEPSTSKKIIQHKDSVASLNSSTSAESDSEDNKSKPNVTLRNPDANAILKLRRSSLQRQKKIELDYDEANNVENKEQTTGTNKPAYQIDENLTKRAEKIPVRFISSGNLKLLMDKETNDKTPEEIRLELEEEIKSLSQKIQLVNSQELTSVLLQIKDLRTRLDNQ